MAVRVSPLRALLLAQLQASWNRSRKELSRQGRWALVLVGILMVFTALLPLVAGAITGGYALGKGLPSYGAMLALAGATGALVWMGGLFGGIVGGARHMDWERHRAYPLSPHTRFAAELLGGLGDLLPLSLSVTLACLYLGLSLSQPRLIPWLLLFLGMGVGTLLLLQMLTQSLAEVLVKRLRYGLAALGLVVWAMSALSATLAHKVPKGGPRPEAFDTQALQASLATAGRVLEHLPGSAPAMALGRAQAGAYGAALGWMAYALAVLFALGLLAWQVLQREAAPALVSHTDGGKGAAKLWSIHTPTQGIAQLHLRTLLGSTLGKFGLVMPLMTLVLVKGPMAQMKGSFAWVTLPGAFIYLSMTNNQTAYNLFGMDGSGISGLMLLPLRARDLLRGKLLGLAIYQGFQVLVLVLLLGVMLRPRPAELVASLGLGLCLFLAQGAVGIWTSTWMPRPQPRSGLKGNNMPLALVLISLAAIFTATLVYGGIYLLLTWVAPGLLVGAMLLLAALSALGIHLSLPAAAAYLDQNRERLVERLG